ncbi:MAG: hypothetical protein CL792_06015 [Chloroflexi bacterium]|nr:hypothetical protein [Chloroflexota bacterium]|tara:strand:- start:3275 stop:3667 length:393 start_codon:yes stop_codon:yes gene_type:complete
MPIYQYQCLNCKNSVELFFRSVQKSQKAICPDCNSPKLKKLISKVAQIRSDQQRLDGLDINHELGKLDGKSEADFARWSRRMGNELGDELGSEFRNMADRADAGDDPIERVDPAHTLRHQVDKQRDSISE